MTLPDIDTAFLLDFLASLLNIPSPTGFTETGMQRVESALRAFPMLGLTRTRKGALVADWPGEESTSPRALTAHVDTLGAMVKEVKPNGRLKLSKVGGFAWNSVEGEGCTVFTGAGGSVRGSLFFPKPPRTCTGHR